MKFLGKLSELGELMEQERVSYEAENDAWWSRLSTKEREDAFYAVVKRVYQGELVEQGTYRYILYDIFGFDGSMYMRGMDCGFMALHNAIKTPDEEQIIFNYLENKSVPRKNVTGEED